MSRRPLRVFGRFLTVGLACALLHNAIMLGGYWLGLHYAVSSVISFVVVVAFGYWLHSTWSFPDAERGRMPFARYALIASANLPLSIAGMFAFVDLGGVSVPLAAPLVTVLLVMFNFLGGRWALKVGRPLWRT
jgi:putative flippase GtrA